MLVQPARYVGECGTNYIDIIKVATVLVAHSGLVPEGSSRSRAASELAEMFARADGETEALPDKGPDAAARSALEFLRRLTESLGLVE